MSLIVPADVQQRVTVLLGTGLYASEEEILRAAVAALEERNADLRAELQQTLADIAKGIRDPEKMKVAGERMDRMRERNRELFGELDVGVDIIREMRDGR